ncbi:nicotinate (nicotinamide) nucleotide adenylyltransferase [uncultured Bacteroides sp.]|uniref:nicotinate (nicotinamide) nucleotide adenylyltransferase n=1 Tax=uncultured Bacteroides sp. TaxID=162156 RepID=UPI00262C962E|nr:nicotinate (nicotinamide) nucleotide adenylyltransferase [uncultured Bacteroides sp.]
MNIGIFSGSFNPIHVGHLALANYLCEFEGLDELWFLVTPRNPFKQGQKLLPDALRLELVRVAISGYSRFRASDFEFRLPQPSYTIHTLDKLKEVYPQHTFHLIIGSDNWQSFSRWYCSDRLLSENSILVYPRPGYPVDTSSLPPTVRLVSSPVLEISSTFIRQALSEGRDIRYFLHPQVYRMLKKFDKEKAE